MATAGSGIVAATANDSGQGDACHPMPYLAFPTACIVSLDCVIGYAGREGGWVGGAMGGGEEGAMWHVQEVPLLPLSGEAVT